MGLPVDEGLSVLYVLCREWLNERSLLAALGVKNPDRLDEILGLTGTPPPRDRLAQVAAMGGEIQSPGR